MIMFILGFLAGVYVIGVMASFIELNRNNFTLSDMLILPWLWPAFLVVFLVVAPIALFLDWRERRIRHASELADRQ